MEQIWLRFGQIIKNSINAISSLSFSSVIKTFIIALFMLTLLMIYNIIQSNLVVSLVEQRLQNIELNESNEDIEVNQSIAQRIDITPKVDAEITQLLYKLDAARVCVTEFHNSIQNMAGLHFQMFSMTYEVINTDNTNITYIANGYQSQNVSLYKIPSYICMHDYLNVDIQEMKKVDMRWALLAGLEGIKREAFYVIKDINGAAIGMVSIAWTDDISDISSVRGEMLASSLKIGNYLSYKKTQVEAI